MSSTLSPTSAGRRRRGRLHALRRDGRAGPRRSFRRRARHLYDAYLTGGWMKGPMGLADAVQRGIRRGRSRSRSSLVTSVPSSYPAGDRPGLSDAGRSARSLPPSTPTPCAAQLSTFRFPGLDGACRRSWMRAPTWTRASSPPPVPASTRATCGPRPTSSCHLLRAARRGDATGVADGRSRRSRHTMPALAHDLPLVVMPMDAMLDQPMVARSVELAGAGRVVRRRRRR